MTDVTPDNLRAYATACVPERIDVWFFGTDAALFDDGALDEREAARGARFVTETLRRRFCNAHAGLRAILAAYLGCAPRAVEIVQGPHGKPALRDARLHFNLTDKDAVAALAVAAVEVGVDCECVDAALDYRPMLARVAHPSERLDEPERFFRTWSRKEAVMKQRGLGFLLAPSRIEAFAQPAADPAWRRTRVDGGDGPFVRDLDAPEGYVAALAAETEADVRILTLAG